MLDKTFLNDSKMSWRAKGLLAYMLSKPDDWFFYMDELERQASDGIASLRSAFKELQDKGYVKKERKQDEHGKFVWETTVYELPSIEKPYMDKPSMESPSMEKPSTGEPSTVNRTLLNNDLLSNDLLNNKELNNKQLKQQEQEVAAITQFWDNNGFGYNNINAKQSLLLWLDDSKFKNPSEMILKALDIASKNNKRTGAYVEGILKNWEKQSILTPEEADQQRKPDKNRGTFDYDPTRDSF